jgi:hypothetical protein
MDEVRTAPSGLVERVAKAMCDGNWDAANFNETMNGDEPEDQRNYWREKARAAIEAMRVPTEAMITEGCNSGEFEDRGDVVQPHAAKHVYTSMIDAALAEANAERERSS